MGWRQNQTVAAPAEKTSHWSTALRRGLETHVSLPLFSVFMLAVLWGSTWHFISAERVSAVAAAADSLRELADTYEAQVARNLGAIDQTLKMTSYAAMLKGTEGALPELQHQGLLPPGLVFAVSIVDRDGVVRASNPPAPPRSVARQGYFAMHRARLGGVAYVRVSIEQHGGAPVLAFTRGLEDARGQFAGLVMVQVDPAYFTSGYERSRLGEHGMLGLFGGEGQLRALRVGEREQWEGAGPTLSAVRASPAWDGAQRETLVRQLSSGLTVVVGLEADEQLAAFQQHRRSNLLLAGVASGVLILFASLGWLWSWQSAKARRSIRRAQETYAAASEANLDAFFMLHSVRNGDGKICDFRIATANSRAEDMTGMSRQRLQGLKLSRALPSLWRQGLFDRLVRATENREVYEEEWQNDIPRVPARWLHQQLVGVEDGVVAIVRDISERKQAEARILHMAEHDALTGLPNRNVIDEKLDAAIVEASKNRNAVLVCFIDLDGFKLINDHFGHSAGDELLMTIGERMRNCIRQHDTVGRFGGDEFVLVLQWRADQIDAAGVLLEKVRAAVTMPLTLLGQITQISCSIGVAVYPRDGDRSATLLLNADAAMYRAKAAGKNNYQFFHREMNAAADGARQLQDRMRHAIAAGEFHLLYQPKIDLRSGQLFGVEALVRWEHPQQGMISPLRFIPLAEESGVIVELGEWVLRTACDQNQAWRDAGLPPITVAVNVSARQFDEQGLVGRVALALADSGLDAGGLELEVTESLVMRDLDQAVAKMRALAAMGLSLSIDDFGTGYSSLSALKSYPIGRLKIDQSFVRDLVDSADDQAIVCAIIAMAHQLNLRVIAEGVETEAQRAFLQANACDEMQGFLFSRPVGHTAISAMLGALTC